MKSVGARTISLILLALSAITWFLPGCHQPPTSADVVQIIDGDTIIISGGYIVRYSGIDTPEKNEPYYHKAWQANYDLIAGKVIRLETDVTDKDKYGRLLRYIFVNGIFVNEELVKQGYARVYPKDRFPDNKYYERFKEAEREARQQNRGIWQDNN